MNFNCYAIRCFDYAVGRGMHCVNCDPDDRSCFPEFQFRIIYLGELSDVRIYS
jgi:hypothetical protein